MSYNFREVFGPQTGNQVPARYIRSETTQWLGEPQVPWHVDGLEWWKHYGHRDRRGLAVMARAYLAIPGSKVPAEPLFSPIMTTGN